MDILLIVMLVFGLLVAVGAGLALRGRSRRGPLEPLAPPVGGPPAVPSIAPAEAAVGEQERLLEVAPVPMAASVAPPRLRDRLGRTRAVFGGPLDALRRRGALDDSVYDDLEETLLLADVGVATTGRLLDGLRARVKAEHIVAADVLVDALRTEVAAILDPNADRTLASLPGQANVWMFVGVNGVGKTTTIAKVARREIASGRSVLLAAADTFRAAAAEQLAHWADRVGASFVRGQEGADPASVVFDAMSSAAGRHVDLVLIDTAGRLHTNVNLMAELEKLRRIVERTPGALQEVLLVLDATTGQNGLAQAKQFTASVAVTGVVLTKLDSSAKGGIVLAIEGELGIPVKLVGLGESADDLVAFDPAAFADALVNSDGEHPS